LGEARLGLLFEIESKPVGETYNHNHTTRHRSGADPDQHISDDIHLQPDWGKPSSHSVIHKYDDIHDSLTILVPVPGEVDAPTFTGHGPHCYQRGHCGGM